MARRPGAPKGTPTALNVWTLAQLFNGQDEAPNRMEPTAIAGVRRCFKAGLVEVSADKKTLRLTDKGRDAIAAETSIDPAAFPKRR